MATQQYYLSLDIESTGPAYNNTVNAIGIYWAPVDPTSSASYIKRRWCLQPLPGDTDDEKTMTEFWSKFPDVLATIRKEARPTMDVLREFRDFLRTATESLGIGKTTILTDCPQFDLGRLDYLGHARSGLFTRPLQYMEVNERHGVSDPGERLAQLGPGAEERFNVWLAKTTPNVKHTHLPDDDAEHSYWMMVYCDQMRPTK